MYSLTGENRFPEGSSGGESAIVAADFREVQPEEGPCFVQTDQIQMFPRSLTSLTATPLEIERRTAGQQRGEGMFWREGVNVYTVGRM